MRRRLIWRTIPFTNGMYHISNEGEIRKLKDIVKKFSIYSIAKPFFEQTEFALKEQNIDDYIYKSKIVEIYRKGILEVIEISSLMFESFHGIVGITCNEILHLDGNELNNNLENLILCFPSQKKQFLIAREKNVKPILANFKNGKGHEIVLIQGNQICLSEYNLNGELMMTYPNIVLASKSSNFKLKEINKSLHGLKQLNCIDKIYKLGMGPKKIETSLIRKNEIILYNVSGVISKKMMYQYSETGKLLKIYNNVNEASIQNDIPKELLLQCLRGPYIINGYFWMFQNNELID